MVEKQVTNPVKVIRRYCLECCLESPKEVELCPAEGCWLHPFRMGTNPFRAKRELSAEEKAVLAQRLRGSQDSQKNA